MLKKRVEFEGIKRIVQMKKEKPSERNDFFSSVDEVKQCNRTTEILSADECENSLRLKEGKVLEDDVRVRGTFKKLKYIFICGNI